MEGVHVFENTKKEMQAFYVNNKTVALLFIEVILDFDKPLYSGT